MVSVGRGPFSNDNLAWLCRFSAGMALNSLSVGERIDVEIPFGWVLVRLRMCYSRLTSAWVLLSRYIDIHETMDLSRVCLGLYC